MALSSGLELKKDMTWSFGYLLSVQSCYSQKMVVRKRQESNSWNQWPLWKARDWAPPSYTNLVFWNGQWRVEGYHTLSSISMVILVSQMMSLSLCNWKLVTLPWKERWSLITVSWVHCCLSDTESLLAQSRCSGSSHSVNGYGNTCGSFWKSQCMWASHLSQQDTYKPAAHALRSFSINWNLFPHVNLSSN